MNRTFRAVLLIVLLSIIGSAAFVSYKLFFSGASRSVPLLKGNTVIEAVRTLERMGAKARIEEENSGLPRGTVIGQWPETGVKLRADKPVILKVSRGSDKKSIPDLRGLTQVQAVDRLQELGFIVGEIQKIHHEHPAGVVIAQSPAAPADVASGHDVGLLVSLGPAVSSGLVVVPDLRERDVETAVDLARESSLKPHIETVYETSAPQGMVVKMSPVPGSRVARNSTVTMKVASWDPELAPRPSRELREASAPEVEHTSTGGAKVVIVGPGESGVKNTPARTPAEEQGSAAPAVQEVKKPGADLAGRLNDVVKNGPAKPKTKKAKIRYQAPPVPGQTVMIELIDKAGDHTVLNREVKPGEFINIDAPYVGEAVVTIYLGGNFVWQERYR